MVDDDAVEITATVRTTDRTGVEMEALTAVWVAALTVVDMVKAVDKAAVDHRHPRGVQDRRQVRRLGAPVVKASVVVASNRAAAGVYADATGPLIVEALLEAGFDVGRAVVVPDGEPVGDAIRAAVDGGARVVLTTGGTGLTPDRPDPRGHPPAAGPRGPRHRRGDPRPRCRQGGRHGLAVARSGRRRRQHAGGEPARSRGGVKDGSRCSSAILVHAVEQIVGSDH